MRVQHYPPYLVGAGKQVTRLQQEGLISLSCGAGHTEQVCPGGVSLAIRPQTLTCNSEGVFVEAEPGSLAARCHEGETCTSHIHCALYMAPGRTSQKRRRLTTPSDSSTFDMPRLTATLNNPGCNQGLYFHGRSSYNAGSGSAVHPAPLRRHTSCSEPNQVPHGSGSSSQAAPVRHRTAMRRGYRHICTALLGTLAHFMP